MVGSCLTGFANLFSLLCPRWLANSDKGFLEGNPHMRLIPVQAFRFEPVYPLDGFMSLDAESVAFEPLQGRILRGKARVMSEV